jgi:hypothetical protein
MNPIQCMVTVAYNARVIVKNTRLTEWEETEKQRSEGDIQRNALNSCRVWCDPPPASLWRLWRSMSTALEPLCQNRIFFCWFMPSTTSCCGTSIRPVQKLYGYHKSEACVWYSDPSTQYHTDSHIAKWDWPKWCTGSVITWLKTYADTSPVLLNLDYMPANTGAVLSISKLLSPIQSQRCSIGHTHVIPKWILEICNDWAVGKWCISQDENSPIFLILVELCIMYSLDCEMHMWSQASSATQFGNG